MREREHQYQSVVQSLVQVMGERQYQSLVQPFEEEGNGSASISLWFCRWEMRSQNASLSLGLGFSWHTMKESL